MSRYRYAVQHMPGDKPGTFAAVKLSLSAAGKLARRIVQFDTIKTDTRVIDPETSRVVLYYRPDPFSARGYRRDRSKESAKESTGNASAKLRAERNGAK